LQIVERLSKEHIKCTVLTKGTYPADLTDKDKYGATNEYGITLVSLDERFRNEYEPNTAKFKDRIKALKRIHDNGAKTWVSMEPYPTPNIVDQDLAEILNEIRFVDKIVFGRLNYNVKSSQWLNHREYYNECVDLVVQFCENNKINYHIKNGTKT
jgi:DNA repair photolyase